MQTKVYFLKGLCAGKYIDSNSIEVDYVGKNYKAAMRVFKMMKPSEVTSCKDRDEGYVNYLLNKYTNSF